MTNSTSGAAATSTRERQHNIPQLLNFALATGVVVTVGDSVQNLVQEPSSGEPVDWTNYVLLGWMFALAIKVFMDEHEILAAGKIRPSIIVDVIFLVLSYCLLIAACSLARHFEIAILLVGWYFVALALWNVAALLLNLSRRFQIPPDSRNLLIIWLGIDAAGAVVAFASAVSFDLLAEMRREVLFLLFAVLIADFVSSPTRSYKYS